MDSSERDLAIRTIIGEAGGEPPTGQAGVAWVIKNRLASGQYPNSLKGVILQPAQFSLWNAGDPAGAMANRVDPSSSEYQRVGQIFDKVMAGQIADPTGGATHYYNPQTASPAWGPKLAQQNDVTIGNHRFVGTGAAGPGGGLAMLRGRGTQGLTIGTQPGPVDPSIIARGGVSPPIGGSAPAVAAQPTGPLGISSDKWAALEKSLGEGGDLNKALDPQQSQAQEPELPQAQIAPTTQARNVSPMINPAGLGIVGSQASQMQQALGYHPSQLYGTGLTSTAAPALGRTMGQNANQQLMSLYGQYLSPYALGTVPALQYGFGLGGG